MAGGHGAFGALLRELRLARSLTIEGLSESSGISVRGIGDLERDRRAAPQRRTVAALADGLSLDEPERERLLAAARSGRSSSYRPVGVRSFPRGVEDFAGRDRELALLAEWAEESRARPVVVAVSGTPGAGKTTLALHTARRVADGFPDGQLLVDLRGTHESPPTPAELIVTVLKALGTPDRELSKAGPQGHAALYRHVLSDRRLLLVLDNARDEAQVRPLLPGAGAVLTVVTSRRMLTGLEGVHRLWLGQLGPMDARALLASIVGTERAAAEPGALADVAERCGCLPLALRVAGNWLATRTGWTVRRLAERLAQEERRLDALSAGDVRVAAAFDLSYRQLTPGAARMFRLLALVPGPDTGAAGAAMLTGQDLFDAEDTLEELVEAGLLGTDGSRYRLHDLLDLYARARLGEHEPAGDVERSREELYRWLLETAVLAGRWYEPEHGAPPASWRGTVDLSSAERAREWLQAEGANWLAALRAASAAGRHAPVAEVAEALHWFSDQWIFWGHWAEVFGLGVRAAEALGDPLTEATQLNYVAWALLLCEARPRDSLVPSARALAAAERAGDLVQQAWSHQYSGWAHRLLGELDEAFGHVDEAAGLFARADDVHGLLQTTFNRALMFEGAGRAEEAIDAFRVTLGALEENADRIEPHVAAVTRLGAYGGMGTALSRLECWDEAVAHFERALDICGEMGNTALESRELTLLSDALQAAGRIDEARACLVRCVGLGPGADPQRVSMARDRLALLDAAGDGRGGAAHDGP
ncbi:tetratricopeptide repeat protein [Streptomyces sp. NPDC002057]|uniref:ATP-binding protein n=1 Tax=Streptomyces sp. NPDC002057 TaxID=3154664 RepID=UPI0033196E0D